MTNKYLAIYESLCFENVCVDSGLDEEKEENTVEVFENIEELEKVTYIYNKRPEKFLDIIIRLTKQQHVDLILGKYRYTDLEEKIQSKEYPWDKFIVAIKPLKEPGLIEIISKDYEKV